MGLVQGFVGGGDLMAKASSTDFPAADGMFVEGFADGFVDGSVVGGVTAGFAKRAYGSLPRS